MPQSLHVSEQPFKDSRVGIIDIGSNSIRLVIYDQLKRSPVPIYNEKVMCALGKGLAKTGMLSPEGVKMARDTLRRFLAMGRNMEITTLYVIATAAVREATDGVHFTRELEKEHDIDIEVISGKREARLGAYGVCSSMHQPHGITGDLGGGSLELVYMDNGMIEDHTSLPLGGLRMIDETGGDREKIRALVDKNFNGLSWLHNKEIENFYAIGGGFRALARIHMTLNQYPLQILHQYEVDASEFYSFAQEIVTMKESALAKLPGVAQKRLHQLPGAALVLQNIIQHCRPESIIFSGSGIREGYFYEKLSPYTRQQDGLLTSCTEFITKGGRSPAYANELFEWMSPLLTGEDESLQRLRMAFCLLSDIALHIHPSYRADWAYHRILFSALNGLSHHQRVKLSLALYHRYNFKLKSSWPTLDLLDEKDRHWARLTGTMANLAYHLTGNIAGTLQHSSISVKEGKVKLQLDDSIRDTMGDAVQKRVDGVQEAFEGYKGTR
ncbi:MAG: Ppx/GppA family phosphatase [Alphaproteobacteria bacterium]